MALNADGILTVSGKDKRTGNVEQIEIDYGYKRLGTDDLRRMKKTAQEYKRAERKAKLQHEFEIYFYSLRNQLSDKRKLGGNLPAKDKTYILSEMVKVGFFSPVKDSMQQVSLVL